MLVQSVPVTVVPSLAQTAKEQTQPGVTVAAAAGAKGTPEVRRDTYVFAPAQVAVAGLLSLDDASNANEQEAEAARSSDGAMPALRPPPRREEDDPAAHFIPAPKPLIGPAPARVPLLGFDLGGNAALEEVQKLAQAEQAYRSSPLSAGSQPTGDDAP